MRLYNSLAKEIERFQPISDKSSTLYHEKLNSERRLEKPQKVLGKKVHIYVCGITPYDTTHLGHAFTYISFDVLVRYLLFKGYKVTYTQNITDINDRDNDLLKRAKEQKVPWHELAVFWTKRFLRDMKKLNWRMPENFLKASQQIGPMIKLIELLLKNGVAYKAQGNVFLDITRFPQYGRLSDLSKKEMLTVAKEFEEDIDNPLKKHELDITLWRKPSPNQPKHIPSFNSPYGTGRPGWHIECSAMAISSLGAQIDIHGGGQDLKFPHHEAEIIQSEGATNKKPFVKYWLHTGTVSYKGAKMSKSLGNLILVSDLLKKYPPSAIRWMLLSHHYQTSWEFTENEIKKAEQSIKTVHKAINKSMSKSRNKESLEQFTMLMDNNLQTPDVLSYVLELSQKTSKNTHTILSILRILGFRI